MIQMQFQDNLSKTIIYSFFHLWVFKRLYLDINLVFFQMFLLLINMLYLYLLYFFNGLVPYLVCHHKFNKRLLSIFPNHTFIILVLYYCIVRNTIFRINKQAQRNFQFFNKTVLKIIFLFYHNLGNQLVQSNHRIIL